jgi:hypothetical protein
MVEISEGLKVLDTKNIGKNEMDSEYLLSMQLIEAFSVATIGANHV